MSSSERKTQARKANPGDHLLAAPAHRGAVIYFTPLVFPKT
jgi:hypothetical protein